MLFTKNTALAAGVLFAGLASCSKPYVDPATSANTDNTTAITAYNTDTLKAQKDPSSGLYYAIRKANPTGKLPVLGDEIGFTYKISTLKNVVVDQRDTIVYASPYGIGQFIVDAPLKFLRTGETGTFLLPSELAFGSQVLTDTKNVTVLPAYSPVRLDVKLISSLTEEEQIDRYITANKLTITEKTTTGLRFIKTKDNPSGAVLTSGQIASVVYTGKLLRGTKPFDSGTFPLTLGQNGSVAGFEEGVRKLKVGEKATVIMPSAIGYGTKGYPLAGGGYAIYPYAPLVFDIEIASAK